MVAQLDIEEIKRRLRLVRRELNISQREAATKAHISKSVLEKYESRENQRIPNTRQLFQLAEAYDVSVDYLLVRDKVAEVASPH
ncbi:MAG: helix-turn-helix transcriptional regulator [Planctomycetes bacterium]|nr:helix-turn-helix transcriptional regulator [Planctomycetota bacterium]MCB9869093.1 helix-turn-helix transcriptional regulator [Planctomycetota bacterium]MCB9889266.1 helix-turn-helix transcriptional regulator [Planctomycetota bacterium]